MAGSSPPSLPPVVKGARDAWSGSEDILGRFRLRQAHDFFARTTGKTKTALSVDDVLGGVSAGFDFRQGRAMELAPLMEVSEQSEAHEHEQLFRGGLLVRVVPLAAGWMEGSDRSGWAPEEGFASRVWCSCMFWFFHSECASSSLKKEKKEGGERERKRGRRLTGGDVPRRATRRRRAVPEGHASAPPAFSD